MSAVPIPPLSGVAGRESVPIRECGEDLLALSLLAPRHLRVESAYYRAGRIAARLEAYARVSVARMLQEAAQSLPADYKLAVLDAWRPLDLQRELWQDFREAISDRHPTLSTAEVDERARAYVSPPSLDPTCPPPHLTGGAVDVTILDDRNQPLALGTTFDWFGPEAATRYFERKLEQGHTLSPRETECLENRRLLFHTLTRAGFTNYYEEWWHYDYGNQFWAVVESSVACYGPVDLPSS